MYFIAEPTHSGTQRVLDNLQRVMPGLTLVEASGEQKEQTWGQPSFPIFLDRLQRRTWGHLDDEDCGRSAGSSLSKASCIPINQNIRTRALSRGFICTLLGAIHMADPAARKILNQLIQREGLSNKACCDCNNPNPQWASLRCADPVLDDADI